jgi:hypothetical protein
VGGAWGGLGGVGGDGLLRDAALSQRLAQPLDVLDLIGANRLDLLEQDCPRLIWVVLKPRYSLVAKSNSFLKPRKNSFRQDCGVSRIPEPERAITKRASACADSGFGSPEAHRVVWRAVI